MKRLATALFLALAACLPSLAQAAPAPPSLPVLARYQYWPRQYVLFLGPELPYTVAEFDLSGAAKTPVYNLVLTERSGGRRITYTNDDQIVQNETASGGEAHKAEFHYEPGETDNAGSVSTLRLTLADGQPLLWRFVQGSDVSERGSGVTPMPQMPMPVLAYREQGALAGEGTALQIGRTVSQAAVWDEMSQPPYFIAYHGAYAESAQRLVFVPGEQQWTVVSAPAKLEAGQAWELTSAKGLHRTLRIQSLSGTSVVLSGTDQNLQQMRFQVNATYTGGAWTVENIRYAPVKDGDKHFIDLHFTPAFGDQTTVAEMEVMAAKRTRLASGTITLSGPPADRVAVLAFKKPDWISTKSVTVETKTVETRSATGGAATGGTAPPVNPAKL